MRQKIVRMTVAAAVGTIASFGPPSLAQAVTVAHVPCSAGQLATALASASSGETLSLTRGCSYVLRQGLPIVSSTLDIAGNGATLVRSYAPGTAKFDILTVESGNLTVSRLNFRNGAGALYATADGQLTVNGGTFTGNSRAIDSHNVDYSPQISNATFVRNSNTAIHNSSIISSVEVSHCTFIANKGGAISEYGAGGTIADSTFRRNTSPGPGGAVWLDENNAESLAGDIFIGNSTTSDGGAIYNDGSQGNAVLLSGSKILGNHAGGRGGGLYTNSSPVSTVTGTDIHGNSAAYGGGIENASSGDIDVSGSTISGNRAAEDGGGIDSEGFFGSLSVTASTISVNRASAAGGGVYNQGGAEVTGTRVLRNRAVRGGGIYDDVGATFSMATSAVLRNQPDNCEPLGSILGCG